MKHIVKRSELKSSIKSIVREAIADKMKSNIPQGKLAGLFGKDKGKMTLPPKGGNKLPSVLKKEEKVNENGPQYKVVSPCQCRCVKCNHAFEVQQDPKLTEADEKKPVKVAHPVFDKMQTIIKVCETLADMVESNPHIVREKLLEMAENLKGLSGGMEEASYKKVSPNETDKSDEDKARTIQDDPEVTENHKVQTRSYTDVNDSPQDPKNVRDPEVPMS